MEDQEVTGAAKPRQGPPEHADVLSHNASKKARRQPARQLQIYRFGAALLDDVMVIWCTGPFKLTDPEPGKETRVRISDRKSHMSQHQRDIGRSEPLLENLNSLISRGNLPALTMLFVDR